MKNSYNSSIHGFIGSNGVPCLCVADVEGARGLSPWNNGNCICPRGRCTCLPNECRPYPPYPPYPPPYPPYPPFPPEPGVFPYIINYYANSIEPTNLLGSITGEGQLGDLIAPDLTLFAPPGYQVPGTRSGAEYISAVPENNVVNVVYNPQLINWLVEYYADTVAPANLLGVASMMPVPYGTVITLTPEQLNAYQPASGYDTGEQVGGPIAIIMQNQVISVVYPLL